MKQLLTLDIESITETINTDNKLNLILPIYTKNKINFIHHLLALYQYYPLVRNPTNNLISMSRTIKNMPDFLETPEGSISKSKAISYIWMTSKLPRSALVSSMTKRPEFGSLTPLFMYAHKLYNNIKYSEWDRNDSYMGAALGLFLREALEFSLQYPYMKQGGFVNQHPQLRKALVKGKAYTAYPTFLKYSYTEDPTDGNAEGDTIEYNKNWLILANQYWLANVELRDTKKMILDIDNFGAAPKSLDAIAPVVDKKVERITVRDL